MFLRCDDSLFQQTSRRWCRQLLADRGELSGSTQTQKPTLLLQEASYPTVLWHKHNSVSMDTAMPSSSSPQSQVGQPRGTRASPSAFTNKWIYFGVHNPLPQSHQVCRPLPEPHRFGLRVFHTRCVLQKVTCLTSPRNLPRITCMLLHVEKVNILKKMWQYFCSKCNKCDPFL